MCINYIEHGDRMSSDSNPKEKNKYNKNDYNFLSVCCHVKREG
jgi:hypothetical protein